MFCYNPPVHPSMKFTLLKVRNGQNLFIIYSLNFMGIKHNSTIYECYKTITATTSFCIMLEKWCSEESAKIIFNDHLATWISLSVLKLRYHLIAKWSLLLNINWNVTYDWKLSLWLPRLSYFLLFLFHLLVCLYRNTYILSNK